MNDFRTFGTSEKIENSEKISRTAVRGHRPRPLDDGSRKHQLDTKAPIVTQPI